MHILCPHCKNPIEVVKLTPREEIACPSCGSSFRLESGSSSGWERQPGQRLGRFEVIDAVGQGAFGTVYQARDPELDRTVAIKVPRAGDLAGPQELDRFLREARSVAQLRHPSIVTVHEIGQTDGLPYLVSDFVHGVTLAELLSARRPGFREAAGLAAAVADALHFAHERGVVHRDVKPSNIMLGEDGRPVVMDFGLAKRDAGEVTMTVEGQVLGTPAYMSPEQARGDAHKVDGRSDVYSLGVILYELLTGELPFRGTKRMLLHQVLHDEPRRPRNLNDHIPRDLETVCLKAMEKEPHRRYGTAKELADDLRRWLNGEAIHARAVGRLERASRWARRHPAAAALVGVSALAALAVVGLAVGLLFHGRLQTAYTAEEQQRQRAENALGLLEVARAGEEAQRLRAEEALALANRVRYKQSIFLAGLALRENNVGLARQHLDGSDPALRGWEWRCLNAQLRPELLSVPGKGSSFSPDGTRLATADADRVRIHDLNTGREVLAVKTPLPPLDTAFSPDGSRLAAVGSDTRSFPGACGVWLFDVGSGRQILALENRGWSPGQLAFSTDGTLLAVPWSVNGSGFGEMKVRVFDTRTGKETFAVNWTGMLPQAAFSPDGAHLAVTSSVTAPVPGRGDVPVEFALRVHDVRSGREVFARKTPAGRLSGPVASGGATVAYSPDGSRLAILADVVRVYDANTGRELLGPKEPSRVVGFAFSPDGSRLLTYAVGGAVRVFEARTGQETVAIAGPFGARAAFSPDGTQVVVSGGSIGPLATPVQVFDAQTGRLTGTLRSPSALTYAVFSPDGRRISAQSHDGLVRVFEARPEFRKFLPGQPFWWLGPLTQSRDGTRALTGGSGGLLRVIDPRTQEEVMAIPTPTRRPEAALSPDGTMVAVSEGSGRGDGLLRLYDARTGREARVIGGLGGPVTPAFSPDGGRVAVAPLLGQRDGAVRVFDTRTGVEIATLKTAEEKFAVAVFSPDGTRVAAVPEKGKVVVFNAQTGRAQVAFGGPDRPGLPAFSPDGSRVAVPFSKRGAGPSRVFDSTSGREVVTLQGGQRAVLNRLEFSPDGERIAGFGFTHGGLFDARSGDEVLSFDDFLSGQLSAAGLGGDLWADGPEDVGAWQAARRAVFAANALAWHRRQAEGAERSGQWFAATFHLERLLRQRPEDQDLVKRLQAARARLREAVPTAPTAPARMEPVP